MYVFVSYSHSDQLYADNLISLMRQSRIEVWSDHTIRTGDRFDPIIEQAIDGCGAFVVLMTTAAGQKDYVRGEVARAQARHKPILPLLLEGPAFVSLGNLSYEDVSDGAMPSRRFLSVVRDTVTGSASASPGTSIEAPPAARSSPWSALAAIADQTQRRLRAAQMRTVRGNVELPVQWRGVRSDGQALDHLDGMYPDLLSTFDRTTHSRLVVLGASGSGKTALATAFALKLADRVLHDGRELIPALLPLSAWNPSRTSIEVWISQRLRAAYGGILRQHPGVEADSLVSQSRILPIFDGLNEMRPALRATALRRLNHYIGPFVLTSQRTAYHDAVDDPRGVDVVELLPLDQTVVRKYLCQGNAAWTVFYDAADQRPDDADVQAALTTLTTPLGVTLADEVFHRPGAPSPTRLLAVEPPSPQAVLDQLVDAMVDAAFDPMSEAGFDLDEPRRPVGDEPRRVWRRASQARRWLGFLAVNMRDARVPNVRWWSLEYSMPGWVAPLLAALAVGAIDGLAFNSILGRPWSLLAAAVLGLMGAFMARSGRRIKPDLELSDGQDLEKHRDELRAIREAPAASQLGFAISFVVLWAVLAAAGYGLSAAVVAVLSRIRPGTKPLLDVLTSEPNQILALVAYSLLCAAGILIFAGTELWAQSDDGILDVLAPAEIDPRRLRGRWLIPATLTTWTALGIAIVIVVVHVGGMLVDQGLYRWRTGHAPSTAELAAVAAAVVGTGLLYAAAATRSVRNLVARCWLFIGRRIPWRIDDFVTDAARRQILRQIGSVYEFRHEELSRHLADSYRP
jgi:hypothetical protein